MTAVARSRLAPPRRPGRRIVAHPRLLAAVAIVAFILLSHVASLLVGQTPVSEQPYIPTAWDLATSFADLSYYLPAGLPIAAPLEGGDVSWQGALLALAVHSAATAARLLVGFTVGVVASVVVAMALSWLPFVRRLLLFPAHAARMLPLLAMSPLFAIWFGNSEWGVLAFICTATFAIVFIYALVSIGNIPPHYAEYARCMGVGRLRAYLDVLPAALPGIRNGVTLALGLAWSMVLAAELIGQEVGLGTVVRDASEFGRTTTLAVVGVFVVAYAWLSYLLVDALFRRGLDWTES